MAAMASLHSPSTAWSRHRMGFWSVAFAFLVVMAFSTAPSPLYGLYQARDGFSSLVITLIYAVYAAGVTVSLLFAGHLSDWYGRRRVLLPALATSILSAVVFLATKDLVGLLTARVVNGLSVGVLASTATAYLAELDAAARPGAGPRRAQLTATVVNLGGLGLGPVVAGVLAQWGSDPLTVPYVVFLAAMVLAVAVVVLAPETRERAVPTPPYRVQRVSVPDEARGAFAAAATGAFLAFGALGLFTGLASTFLAGTLHHTSLALAGATVGLVLLSSVLVQVATLAWPIPRILAGGMALMLVGLAMTVLAVWLATPSLALFLVGGAVMGGGGGAVFKGTVGTVVTISPPASRAEALAGLFLAGYVGLSIPVVGAGVALQFASARTTLLGFAVLVGGMIIATAPRLLPREPIPAPVGVSGDSPLIDDSQRGRPMKCALGRKHGDI
ncbi:MFS transporter [Acidiferrimicrobium sp. IK]|uniref:MFS transporter n=1 Tax=Acidiferrimicrobium sp. IK TaxID=2871700 RepID=UPI0021CB5D10|nr:MFS transporter [Acidiferrimicrobium sp. IK]MCU4186631.1 MFS transporter [Acidiferrimicrobium sp. IK]